MTEFSQYSTENWTDEDYLRELNALRKEYELVKSYDFIRHYYNAPRMWTSGDPKVDEIITKIRNFMQETIKFRQYKDYISKTSILFMRIRDYGYYGEYYKYDDVLDQINKEPSEWQNFAVQLTRCNFKLAPFMAPHQDSRVIDDTDYPNFFRPFDFYTGLRVYNKFDSLRGFLALIKDRDCVIERCLKLIDFHDGLARVSKLASTKPESENPKVSEFIEKYEDKEASTNNVEEMLEERGARYGDFCGHAKITMDLKRAMHASKNWETLSDDKKECLDMVAHKIGRILNGDPEYKDSWDDCIGYLTLVTNKLKGL